MIGRAALAATAAICVAVVCGGGLAPVGPAQAQGLDLGRKDNKPIEVYAEDGIEWDQKDKRYVARGKARAIQGDTTVHADTLIAHYEEKKGKGSAIYRIDAVGNVRIVSPNQTVYGDRGVYDARQKILVLTGRKLRLVTKDEIVTARDSLEYYDDKSLAVARGNATMRQRQPEKGKERTVRADVLTSQSPPKGGKDGGGRAGNKAVPRRMDAYGNVVITRPGEIALGERGFYLPDQEIAELWGKVRITRDKNQLNGERAVVNFKTGLSRLLAGKGQGRTPPVRVLIVPNTGPAESP